MGLRRIIRLLTVAVVALASVGSFAVPAAHAQVDDTEWPGSPPFVNAEVDGSGSVTLTWGRSTDNVGVVDYRVLRNGVELLRTGDAGRLVILDDLPVGDNYLQVQGIDAAGNESLRTAPVLVNVPARFVSAPVDLYSNWLDGKVQLGFSPLSQRNSLTGAVVWRNGGEFTTLPSDALLQSTSYVLIEGLPHGRSFLQLQLIGPDGTRSKKSAPLAVDVDIMPPAAPFDVEASISGAGPSDDTRWVTVTYDLVTTDDVEGCILRRNLGQTYFAYFPPQPDPDDPTRFRTSDLAPAPSVAYYQVYCFDSAGNRSVRSVPAKIVIDALG